MAGKNLLCVSLINSEIPEELAKKYWLDVEVQITRLERSFGEVHKLYHEANYLEGEAGLKNIQRINENAYQFLKSKIEKGAQLKTLEDKETLQEITDCQRFLTIRFSSEEVQEKTSKLVPEIMQVYEKALQRRREYIPKQISESLADGETGMSLLREEEGMRIQFPSDINVILVRPPVLSEIEKWERDHQTGH
jgi:hypothetical protein